MKKIIKSEFNNTISIWKKNSINKFSKRLNYKNKKIISQFCLTKNL